MSALDQAIKAAGGLSALAKRLGVKPQVVWNWRRRGIPAEWILEIERATDGKVTRHQLDAKLYPVEQAA